jgi:IMP dehydrogenase
MRRLADAAESLAFDDITILPGPNDGAPDAVSLRTRVTRRHEIAFPILSAAMPSVTETAMAIAMGEFGGLGVLHRFMPLEQQCAMVRAVAAHHPGPTPAPPLLHAGRLLVAASCDPRDDVRAVALAAAGARILFLDTPNPDNADVAAGVERIRSRTQADLVIGSVISGQTARRYVDLGVDALKVGLGAGALCSIRRSAGIGLPQATAIERVRDIASQHGVPVISDGGVRCAGDIVKALALGASSVMVGSMLAGCDESPGELLELDGKALKRVAGLKLADFELELPTGYPAVDAYLEGRAAPRVEGRDVTVPATGPCHLTLLMWMRSVRAGVHMTGAKEIPEMWSMADIARAAPSEIVEGARRGA